MMNPKRENERRSGRVIGKGFVIPIGIVGIALGAIVNAKRTGIAAIGTERKTQKGIGNASGRGHFGK